MDLLVLTESSFAPVSRPTDTDTTCSGCGSDLVAHDVVHFERGRRHTTVELLCASAGCEHHTRPARPTSR